MRSITPIILGLALLSAAPASGSEDGAKKIKTGSVAFRGNETFKSNRLLGLMITRPSGFFSRSYYFPEALEDDMVNLEQFYRSSGYLEASASIAKVEIDSTKTEAYITIDISEGELTVIEGVSVFGAKAFTDSLLLKMAGITRNDPFRSKQVQDSAVKLLNHYAGQGYLDATVKPEVRITAESHRAFVDFIVQERGLCTVNDVVISGAKRTREKVITRELTFKKGDIARLPDLLKSQRELYMTGLFQSVFVRPVPAAGADSTLKDIRIEVQENNSLEANLYFGYGALELGRIRTEIINNNLYGSAKKVALSLYASFINYGAEASFSEPRTFGTRWKTDLNLIYEFREEPSYKIESTGGRATIGRKFTGKSNVAFAYRYEKADLSDIKVLSQAEKLRNDIRSILVSFNFDSRDNLFNASRGRFVEWSTELAGSFLKGSEDFWKMRWKAKEFIKISRSTVIATSTEIGWTDFFGRSSDVPLNEKFYLGGPDVMRAFAYRKAGALDSGGEPVGGNFRIVSNLIEFRKALYRMVGGVVFFDVGGLWQEPDDIQFKDLRYCPGAGLRISTPIGIIRADYGINPDRRDGESPGHFYFSIGQAF